MKTALPPAHYITHTNAMNENIGIYPGTFDPITKGHLHIIERASALVGQLIVGVATQENKNPLFSLEERLQMVKDDVSSISPNIKVVPFDGLLVEFARKNNANMIIRGLRAVSDFEYEFQMTGMNSRLAPEIETVFLMSFSGWQFVSSSFIKEIARLGGNVEEFVTKQTSEKILAALPQSG